MDEKLLTRKRVVIVRHFPVAMISDMNNILKLILKRNSDSIILHINTNDASRNTANQLLDKILSLKSFCIVIISSLTMHVGDQKWAPMVSEVNEYLKELNIPIVNNKTIIRKHYI